MCIVWVLWCLLCGSISSSNDSSSTGSIISFVLRILRNHCRLDSFVFGSSLLVLPSVPRRAACVLAVVVSGAAAAPPAPAPAPAPAVAAENIPSSVNEQVKSFSGCFGSGSNKSIGTCARGCGLQIPGHTCEAKSKPSGIISIMTSHSVPCDCAWDALVRLLFPSFKRRRTRK